MSIRTDYYPALYRLWSVIALGAGTAALYEAMDLFEDPTELFCGLSEPEGLSSGIRSRLSPQLLAAKKVPLGKAEAVFEECGKKGISIVPIDSELYPKRLMQLYHPPAVLFVKGDIRGIDDRLSISVVGARRASEYSLRITSAIVRTLGGHGFDIVSGFAEGVDICAHLTAVKSGARTFAVLGTGIDVDYPQNNVKYRKYIEENGAFISEYLPGTVGRPANFPQRNRILVALSLGTAVIEAGAKSGSLNSASHGADQGKPVFAVPPRDLFDSRYYGNSELIRQGAVPLMGARDIYNEYCLGVSHTIDENEPLQQELGRLQRECGSLISGKANGGSPDGKKIRKAVANARHLEKQMKEAAKAENPLSDSVPEASENMPDEENSAGEFSGRAAEKSVKKSAEKPARKFAEKSAEKPAEKSAEKPAEKSAEKPAEKSAEKPARKSAEKPARKSAEKPARKSAEKPARKSAEKSVGKPAKKSAKESVEDTRDIAVSDDLTEEQEMVASVLEKGCRPMRADEIAEVTGRDIDDVLEIITDLELMGVIGSEGSNYRLCRE